MTTQFGTGTATGITQFGTTGSNSATSGSGTGGTYITVPLTTTVPYSISTSLFGNLRVHIECQTSGGPHLSSTLAKTGPTTALVISDVHATFPTTVDKLVLTWANSAEVMVTLTSATFDGENFRIIVY